MRPVVGGTQKITMDSKERDYQQKLRQSVAQGDGNPFVAGVQEVFKEGAAKAVRRRSEYGDVPVKPQEAMLGEDNNFQQKDSAANAPMDDPFNQTASLELQTSATRNPNKDPEDLATDALDKRLRMYAQAGSNAGFGNNNREQTLRLS